MGHEQVEEAPRTTTSDYPAMGKTMALEKKLK
jgi:hypothetical protein